MLKKLAMGSAAVLVTGAMSLMTMGGVASASGPAATTYGTPTENCTTPTATATAGGDLVTGTNGSLGTGPAQVACVTASEDITAGTLHFNSVAGVGFEDITLDGFNQDPPSANELVDVTDATGSNDGWNISITAPPLKNLIGDVNGTMDEANFDAQANDICDTDSTCTLVSEDATPEPLSTSAVIVSDSATGTGEGAQNFDYTFDQPVLASNEAGEYTAVWTYTLSTGPSPLVAGTVSGPTGAYGPVPGSGLDSTAGATPTFG